MGTPGGVLKNNTCFCNMSAKEIEKENKATSDIIAAIAICVMLASNPKEDSKNWYTHNAKCGWDNIH